MQEANVTLRWLMLHTYEDPSVCHYDNYLIWGKFNVVIANDRFHFFYFDRFLVNVMLDCFLVVWTQASSTDSRPGY